MLNIVLFGPPGAGKGTQSENLIKKHELVHIATGDLFRYNIKEQTELGKLAQSYTDNGNLVPDQVVIDMVAQKIEENLDAKGFIFDGFPRTVNQAEALDKMLEEHKLSISGMLALNVPEEELKERIKERGKTSGRADDQDPAKIAHRIEVYKKETTPVADYYQNQNKLYKIDGVGSIEEIFSRLENAIDSF